MSLDSVSERDRAIVAATAPAYSDAGIRLLGYDLLRDDDGHFVVGEINAGNVGGLFRLEGAGRRGHHGPLRRGAPAGLQVGPFVTRSPG